MSVLPQRGLLIEQLISCDCLFVLTSSCPGAIVTGRFLSLSLDKSTSDLSNSENLSIGSISSDRNECKILHIVTDTLEDRTLGLGRYSTSGKGANRKKFPLQKPRWGKLMTISYLYLENISKAYCNIQGHTCIYISHFAILRVCNCCFRSRRDVAAGVS